jgi:glycosyltransferase involved in cell wall biosynthesis
MQDLICISHLRWDFVWQRPQHILSRLAKHYRVFFVEEPMTDTSAGEPHLAVSRGRGESTVIVIRLMQPAGENRWIGHGDPETQGTYDRLLAEFFGQQDKQPDSKDRILWLYTPMAAPFVAALQPDLLVYDVMDELSAFKGAPAALREQDRTMLRTADVVFTGGVSMYRARLPYANNIHLFPSGVEIDHFARAAERNVPEPLELSVMTGPIIGYFGVIDERMDMAALEALATSHPEWNIVMLGPVVKIDPGELPQAPNLHFLGMKDYQELPSYLAYFDVALVPFAMNEATRYLSPTKTLEYLAAGKPVVAAPIADIVELYGDYVRIAETPQEYVSLTEAALAEVEAETGAERRARTVKVDKLLQLHTWDYIAGEMQKLIEAAARPDIATEGQLDPASDAPPPDLQTVGGGLTDYVTPEQQKPLNSA